MVSLALLVQVVTAVFLVLYVFKLFRGEFGSLVLLATSAAMFFCRK
jgi:hypothetical protein